MAQLSLPCIRQLDAAGHAVCQPIPTGLGAGVTVVTGAGPLTIADGQAYTSWQPATPAATTITLPPAPSFPGPYWVVDGNGNAADFPLTVNAAAGIDGGVYALNLDRAAAGFLWTGARYQVFYGGGGTDCTNPANMFAAGCALAPLVPQDIVDGANWLAPSDKGAVARYIATTWSQFVSDIALLAPGDILELTSQTVGPQGTTSINKTGAPTAPITIRAQHQGGVVLNGETRFVVTGAWVRLEGFKFSGSYSNTPGTQSVIVVGSSAAAPCNHCLVDSVSMINYEHTDLSKMTEFVVNGQWNRLSHLAIDGKHTLGNMITVNNAAVDPPDHTLIDSSYFANFPYQGGANGYETIAIGVGFDVCGGCPPYPAYRQSNAVIRDNFFYKTNAEDELVTFKSGGVVFRNNTVQESGNALSFRMSDANVVEGNVFVGDTVALTGGVRVHGDGHVVAHNSFQTLNSNGQLWTHPLSIYAGDSNYLGNTGLYKPVTNLTVAFNSLANNDVGIIVGSPAVLMGTPAGTVTEPQSTRLAQNAVFNPSNMTVLAKSAGSGVTSTGNLCAAVITDPVCSGTATSITNASGVILPSAPSSPVTVPTRAAYSGLGIAAGTLARMYYINRFPGQPIPLKILTSAQVGPLSW